LVRHYASVRRIGALLSDPDAPLSAKSKHERRTKTANIRRDRLKLLSRLANLAYLDGKEIRKKVSGTSAICPTTSYWPNGMQTLTRGKTATMPIRKKPARRKCPLQPADCNREAFPALSSYSPECVEWAFSEVRLFYRALTVPFFAGKNALGVLTWLKKVFGVPSEHEREYAQPEQLADVMALIQVLALHYKYTHRGEDGLNYDLGKPRSVKTDLWADVAGAVAPH
jgi:hypothetical protein